ncbi:MAG: hypothetical protein JZU65_13570, partial [Chlorobium sp.]|nr:hypothetical protein [Chlorobium sp.]
MTPHDFQNTPEAVPGDRSKVEIHKHSKVAKLSTVGPYTGPATTIQSAINPAAHNGQTMIDVCGCGA